MNPDLALARAHIRKSEHNLRAALYLERGGFSDWGISAVFYTMYHSFLAIIAKFGYASRNQECTIALVKHLVEQKAINLDLKFVHALSTDENSLVETRESCQYGVKGSFGDNGKFKSMINDSKELLEAAKKEVYHN
ncbi:MAG: HEPN domain-containing protein [Candidatus Woesearchaeota archaeon]